MGNEHIEFTFNKKKHDHGVNQDVPLFCLRVLEVIWVFIMSSNKVLCDINTALSHEAQACWHSPQRKGPHTTGISLHKHSHIQTVNDSELYTKLK